MSKVWVQNIRPNGLHGFRPGHLILSDLDSAINVVYAPNASGKSTLARAMGLLFNPNECDASASISALIVREGVEEERNVSKREEEYPGFPGRADSYRLDLLQLLQGFKKGEQPFLEKTLAGGINIVAGSPPRLNGWREVRAAVDAARELKLARQAKAEASGFEDLLPTLLQQVEEAERASKNVAELESFVARQRLAADLAEADQAIQQIQSDFPGIECEAPGAWDMANTLFDAVKVARADRDRAVAALVRFAPGGSAPSRPLSEVDRRHVEELASSLRERIQEEQFERRSVAALQAEAAILRDQFLRLFPNENPDTMPIPTPEDLTALRGIAAKAESAQGKALEMATFQSMLDEWGQMFGTPNSSGQENVRLLREWLETERPDAKDPRILPLVGLAVGALVAIAVVNEPGVRFGLGAVAGLAMVGVSLVFRPKTGKAERDALAAKFPPGLIEGEVTAGSVARALAENLKSCSAWEISGRLEGLAKRPLPTADWDELSNRLRVKSADPVLLSPIGQTLCTYLEKLAACAAARERVEAVSRESAGLRSDLVAALEAYGYAADAGKELEAAELFPKWFVATEERDAASGRLADSERKLAEHLVRNGVSSPGSLVEQLGAMKQRRVQVKELSSLVLHTADINRQLEKALVNEVRCKELLEVSDLGTVSGEMVERAIEREEATAASLKERLERVAGAKEQIRRAERDGSIHAKEESYQHALQGVEARSRSLISECIGRRVRGAILDQLRREALPPVVQRANDYLDRFSGGRYRLELGPSHVDGLGLLIVYDRHRGKHQLFEELSTGTKVHTVIGVRLALLDEQEQAANGGTLRFPLVADEALAVSDPEAGKALAAALVEISKDRQVILFTNQPGDVSLLKRLAPGCRALTLGFDVPQDSDPVRDLPTYLPPPGLSVFDPRAPIGAHEPFAVLPRALWNRSARPSRLFEERGPLAPLVAALEDIRRELCEDFRRIEWEDLQDQAWAKTAKSEDLRALIDGSRGCPHMLRASLSTLSGASFNQKHQQQAVGFMEESGFLVDPPTKSDVRRRLHERLGALTDMATIDHVAGVFGQAFVPSTVQLSLI